MDELGPPLELPLTGDVGRALAFSGVVSAVPSPYRPGIWQVGAAGKVGAARVGSVEVFIRPKVAIARLLFLLGYASHGGVWRQDTVGVTSAADLIPVVAQALWRQTERAVHQGLDLNPLRGPDLQRLVTQLTTRLGVGDALHGSVTSTVPWR